MGRPRVKPGNKWIIYVLREVGMSLVRYVGYTKGQLKHRLADHLKKSKTKETYRDKWIQSVIGRGSRIEAIEIESGYGDAWRERESHWIAWYRFIMGSRLTNLTEGGEGTVGYVPTEETRNKLSVAAKGKKSYERTPEWRERKRQEKLGTKHSVESRIKQSLAQTGKKRSQEFKDKISAIHKGKKLSQETIEKVSNSLKAYFSNPENRESMRKSQIGKKLSEEHKSNIGNGVKKAFKEVALIDRRRKGS